MIAALACALSMGGSLAIALNNRFSRYGFIMFLIANVGWSIVAIATQQWFLLLQNLFFSFTSALGIYNTWLNSAKAKKQQ